MSISLSNPGGGGGGGTDPGALQKSQNFADLTDLTVAVENLDGDGDLAAFVANHGSDEPWPLFIGEGVRLFVDDADVLHTRAELDELGLELWPDSTDGLFYQDGQLIYAAYGSGGHTYITTVDGDDWVAAPRSLAVDIKASVPGYKGVAGGPMFSASGSTFGMIVHMERDDDVTGNEYHEFGVAKFLSIDDTEPTFLGVILAPNLAFANRADAETVWAAANGSGQVEMQTIDGVDYYILFANECDASGAFVPGFIKARCSVADWVAAIDADDPPVFDKWGGSDWTEPGLGGLGESIYLASAFPSRGSAMTLGNGAGFLFVWADPESGPTENDFTVWWSVSSDLVTFTPREALWGPVTGTSISSLHMYSGRPDDPNRASVAPIHLTYLAAESPGDPWATAQFERRFLWPYVDDPRIGVAPAAVDDEMRVVEARVLGSSADLGGQAIDPSSNLDSTAGPVEIVFDGVSTFAGGVLNLPDPGPTFGVIKGVRLIGVEVEGYEDMADAGLQIALSSGGPPSAGHSTSTDPAWSADDNAGAVLLPGGSAPGPTQIDLYVDTFLETGSPSTFLAMIAFPLGGAPVTPTLLRIERIEWIQTAVVLPSSTSSGGGTPTVVVGSAAGTAGVATISGNDRGFTVELTTDSDAAGLFELFTVTFSTPFPGGGVVVFSPANSGAGSNSLDSNPPAVHASRVVSGDDLVSVSLVNSSASNQVAGSGTYVWDFMVFPSA